MNAESCGYLADDKALSKIEIYTRNGKCSVAPEGARSIDPHKHYFFVIMLFERGSGTHTKIIFCLFFVSLPGWLYFYLLTKEISSRKQVYLHFISTLFYETIADNFYLFAAYTDRFGPV